MAAMIAIRYCNDGAQNPSDWRDFPAGTTGGFLQQLIVRRLGFARHRIWEIRDTSDTAQDVLGASIFMESE